MSLSRRVAALAAAHSRPLGIALGGAERTGGRQTKPCPGGWSEHPAVKGRLDVDWLDVLASGQVGLAAGVDDDRGRRPSVPFAGRCAAMRRAWSAVRAVVHFVAFAILHGPHPVGSRAVAQYDRANFATRREPCPVGSIPGSPVSGPPRWLGCGPIITISDAWPHPCPLRNTADGDVHAARTGRKSC